MNEFSETNGQEVAVIGVSGRFPGASDIYQYWSNLSAGKESISFATDEELLSKGIDKDLLANEKYIKVKGGLLSHWDFFDAAFFGYSPLEAELMDPQARVFLECSWGALENAGYNIDNIDQTVGVYAGAGSHHNWEIRSFLADKSKTAGLLATTCLTDKDYLSSRVSHKFNLKGPSFTIQASCATSLVAIHVACQALIDGECDMALAGGVSIYSQDKVGYLDQGDSYFSSDGHCRAFDADASGTIGGEGVGVVVLKLLEDAIKDNDHIYAVVKGSAINNDGSDKANYSAPSIDGQRKVIRQAHAFAQTAPQSISYIECHGTGTLLGDPIEVEALKQAFEGVENNSCAIGSVKSNIGHLNGAAGVASFIKTVLALCHRLIPPSINFSKPNPAIDFDNSPFYVNTKPIQWESKNYPLRAGVSAFGIGGTNAHLVLEQAPNIERPVHSGRASQIFTISAKSTYSIEKYIHSVADALKTMDSEELENAAYTLNHGRKNFNHRVCIDGYNREDIIKKLTTLTSSDVRVLKDDEIDRPVIFMFSGQGSEYTKMGEGIYRTEPLFQKYLDECFFLLGKIVGEDISKILYPSTDSACEANKINDPRYSGPIKFSFEYALAKMLMSWGIFPKAMIGHSLGEYVCACISGVMTLEEALELVVLRNRLMDKAEAGAMLSVPLPESEVVGLLNDGICLAAVNTPANCILSGRTESIDAVATLLKSRGVDSIRFNVKRAGHSMLMDPILTEFKKAVCKVALKNPRIPYISGTSGGWITGREAVDPYYWSRHIRDTIHFSKGLQTLLRLENAVFIQVGADRGPVVFVESQPSFSSKHLAINMVRHRKNEVSDERFLIENIGRLWLSGIGVNWSQYYADVPHARLPLPSYPFDSKRFALDDIDADIENLNLSTLSSEYKKENIIYAPSWRQKQNSFYESTANANQVVLLFMDRCGYGNYLAEKLINSGSTVIEIHAEEVFYRKAKKKFCIDVNVEDHYRKLIEEIKADYGTIGHIIHAMNLGSEYDAKTSDKLDHLLNHGFYSLLYLVQALGECDVTNNIVLDVITNNMHEVIGEELTCPEKATMIGAINVIEAEYRHITGRIIDVDLVGVNGHNRNWLLTQLYQEILSTQDDNLVALRGRYRWIRCFERTSIGFNRETKHLPELIKPQGVYVIIGGLGRAGMEISRFLAKKAKARLVLLQRTPMPPRQMWRDYIEEYGKDHPISRKIIELIEFEKEGAGILTFSVDISDKSLLRNAFETVENIYGKINGIFHCAMDPGGGLIQRRRKESIEAVFASKVRGTMIMDQLMENQGLDFVVLFSSISAILPAAGKIAYCAANAFLDGYAHHIDRRGRTRAIAINWNHWEGTPINVAPETAAIIKANGVTKEQGIAILEGLLQNPRPQVLVSRENPERYVRQLKENSLAHYANTTITVGQTEDLLENYRKNVECISPRNTNEEKLTDIWKMFFGYKQIGVQDDFFQLGGDSLKALHIIPKINAQFGCSISIANFYQYHTIEKMAAYLDSGKKHLYEVLTNISGKTFSKTKSLICLPYAAGGSSTYMQFSTEMEIINPQLDIYSINYPGNDLDSPNDVQKNFEAIVTNCVDIIKQKIKTPIAIYGHCVGSYIALDLCARLEREDIKVDFVFIGAILNQDEMTPDEILAMDEEHLREVYLKLGTFKSLGQEVPQDEYDKISRNFKEDAYLITQHKSILRRDRNRRWINAPIINIIGDADETTPDYQQNFEKWREYADDVSLVVLNGGGHYFINEMARETAVVIDRLLREDNEELIR